MTALYWSLTVVNAALSFIGGRTIARWAINHALTIRRDPPTGRAGVYRARLILTRPDREGD